MTQIELFYVSLLLFFVALVYWTYRLPNLTDWVRSRWIHFKWGFLEVLEKVQWAAAMSIPRWLVYLATIRLASFATTGRYETTSVNEVRLVTCLKRWKMSL